MNFNKFIQLFIYLIALLALCISVLAVKLSDRKLYRIDTSKTNKDCHLKALDQCMSKAHYFNHQFNDSEYMSAEHEFDHMCEDVVKVIKCMDNYFKKCSNPTNPTNKDMYEFGKNQFYQSWKQMCTNGPIRDNFIKHSSCIQIAIKDSSYRSKCVPNLVSAFEKTIIAHTMLEVLNIGCCAFNDWQQCIGVLVNDKCGIDGKIAVNNLIEKASGGTIENLCSNQYFDPKSELCNNSLK